MRRIWHKANKPVPMSNMAYDHFFELERAERESAVPTIIGMFHMSRSATTWKDSAGRDGGSDGYRFGDMARATFRNKKRLDLRKLQLRGSQLCWFKGESETPLGIPLDLANVRKIKSPSSLPHVRSKGEGSFDLAMRSGQMYSFVPVEGDDGAEELKATLDGFKLAVPAGQEEKKQEEMKQDRGAGGGEVTRDMLTEAERIEYDKVKKVLKEHLDGSKKMLLRMVLGTFVACFIDPIQGGTAAQEHSPIDTLADFLKDKLDGKEQLLMADSPDKLRQIEQLRLSIEKLEEALPKFNDLTRLCDTL